MTGAEFRGVDVDLLADYIGGALDGTPDQSVVAALIADDPAWRSAYESLTGDIALVVAELGRFEPEPMPDDVAERLEVAFAEAGAKPKLTLVRGDDAPSARESGERPPSARENGDGAPPVRGKRKLRWVTPIAIAAGTVAFVGFGLDYLAGRDGGVADSASSSSAGGEAQARRDKEPAVGAAESNSTQPYAAQPDADRGKAASPQVLASGMDYTKTTLAEPAPQPMSASNASAPAADTLEGPGTSATLQQCLDQIAEANGAGPITAETVDYAKFEGKPAIVVRFTAKNGEWAWASGPACGTPDGGADTRAKVPVR